MHETADVKITNQSGTPLAKFVMWHWASSAPDISPGREIVHAGPVPERGVVNAVAAQMPLAMDYWAVAIAIPGDANVYVLQGGDQPYKDFEVAPLGTIYVTIGSVGQGSGTVSITYEDSVTSVRLVPLSQFPGNDAAAAIAQAMKS